MRAPCCDKSKVRSGPWSPEEDLQLITFVRKHGHPNWRQLPKQAGLLRCGKSCRLRWINYLRPDVKRGNFTPEEQETIINLHNSFGNKWSKIAACLPGRTDNEIKNVWNTHLKRRALNRKLSSVDCHTAESNDSKVDTSASSSACSSENMEKLASDDPVVHESDELRPPDHEENPKFEETLTPTHPNNIVTNYEQQNQNLADCGHSPSYPCGSAASSNIFSSWLDDASVDEWGSCNLREAIDPHARPDNELGIKIPQGFDTDLSELVDCLYDPLQSNTLEEEKDAISLPGKFESQVEFGSWLAHLENELGLTSGGEHLWSSEVHQPPEICSGFDNYNCHYNSSDLWPSSPLYFGI